MRDRTQGGYQPIGSGEKPKPPNSGSKIVSGRELRMESLERAVAQLQADKSTTKGKTLYIVKKDTHLTGYDSDDLSKRYAEQIERGVIVLEKGDSLEIVEEGAYEKVFVMVEE